jgi:hypothetical protein
MTQTPPNAVPVLLEKPEVAPVLISDLTSADHVGFVIKNHIKGYVCHTGYGKFVPIVGDSGYCNETIGHNHDSLIMSLEIVLIHYKDLTIFKFKTRKDLYAWLAE